MIRYLRNTVNQDGGWGLHLARGNESSGGSESTVFATALNYVSLRLLGLPATDPLAVGASACLQSLGGVLGIPLWGKVWLSCLNLYSWAGVPPLPVDIWLLPEWIPMHPWRWWIHSRVVFLPMSYLASKQFTMPLDGLLSDLRRELYPDGFPSGHWEQYKLFVAESDVKRPHSWLLKVMYLLVAIWEQYLRPRWLLDRAQRYALALMRREDDNTDCTDLAPVNKAFQMVSVFVSEGGNSPRLARHRAQLPTYLWLSAEGMTCSGTNGVQVWDTAFSIHAAVEAGLAEKSEFQPGLEQALRFLNASQLDTELDDPHRQPRLGGWPFSTKDNGYIVSDCSAEALKAVMMLQGRE